MTDPFRKARPGDALRIPAAAYNGFIDAAVAHRNSAARGELSAAQPRGGSEVILVRNDSGADLPRFGVLEIDGPILTPTDGEDFNNQICLSGIAVTAAGAWYVVALEPLLDGKIGKAIALGLTQVTVNVSDASHTFAESSIGSQVLVSASAGSARILWAESGTGSKAAIVALTGVTARGGLFAVDIESDGGDGGDYESGSTPASWTYTVSSLAGEELGTGITPERPRPAVEMLEGGPIGVAYFDTDGLHLWDAGEVPDYEPCEEPS